jgi:ferredoxin
VKIKGAAPLSLGDEFRIATKCFRLEKAETGSSPQMTAPIASARSRGGEVRFEDERFPRSFSLGAGKSILQGFIEAGGNQNEPIGWECQTGGCGLCGVEVLSGAQHLESVSPDCDEMKTIAKTAGFTPDPVKHRLACLTHIDGPVVLRRLGQG